MFDVTKLKRNVVLAAAAGALTLAAATPAGAFGVDGIVEAGEYSNEWTISAIYDPAPGGATVSVPSKLFYDYRGGNDFYVAFVIDINFVDNVYGEPSNNPLSGWSQEHLLEKLVKSDKLVFQIDLGGGETPTIQVDLTDENSLGNEKIKDNVLPQADVMTSFNYNFINGFGDFSDPLNKDGGQNSPDPFVLLPEHVGWEQALIYEYKFTNPDNQNITIADFSNVSLHASPNKLFDGKGEHDLPNCLEGDGPTVLCINEPGGPGPGIAEPGTLAVFGFGLVGLGYMRRRRKAA